MGLFDKLTNKQKSKDRINLPCRKPEDDSWKEHAIQYYKENGPNYNREKISELYNKLISLEYVVTEHELINYITNLKPWELPSEKKKQDDSWKSYVLNYHNSNEHPYNEEIYHEILRILHQFHFSVSYIDLVGYIATLGKSEPMKLREEEENKKLKQELEFNQDIITKFMEKKNNNELLAIESFFLYYSDPSTSLWKISDNFEDIDNNIEKLRGIIDSIKSESRNATSIDEKIGFEYRINDFRFQIQFLTDINKLKKLFFSKNVKITYQDILEFCSNYFEKKYDDYLKNHFSNEIKQTRQIHSEKTDFFIKFFNQNILRKSPYRNSPFLRWRILKFGGFDCKLWEIIELDKKLAEHYELKLFEAELDNEDITEPTFDSVSIDGYQFEEFLAQMFESHGWKVIRTPKSRDQGADLIIQDEYQRIVVQAKKYSGVVSNSAVQEIAAARQFYNADKALVVTTGYFSQSAFDLAQANKVILWDKLKLLKFIKGIGRL